MRALMSPEDQARYGSSPNGVATAAVSMLSSDTGSPTKADVRAERALQDEFEQWLRLHGYLFHRAPMHTRSLLPLGHPDFTIYAANGRTVLIEYKTATGKLSPDQIDYHRQLQERGHAVFTSRSLQFSIDCLRAVEAKHQP